jgi:hypothetical protein
MLGVERGVRWIVLESGKSPSRRHEWQRPIRPPSDTAILLTPTEQHHDSAPYLSASYLRASKNARPPLARALLLICQLCILVVERPSGLNSQTTRSDVLSRSRDSLSNGRNDIATHHAGNTMHSTACGNRQSCYTEPVDGRQSRLLC